MLKKNSYLQLFGFVREDLKEDFLADRFEDDVEKRALYGSAAIDIIVSGFRKVHGNRFCEMQIFGENCFSVHAPRSSRSEKCSRVEIVFFVR